MHPPSLLRRSGAAAAAATLLAAAACSPDATIEDAEAAESAEAETEAGPPLEFSPVPVISTPSQQVYAEAGVFYGLDFLDGTRLRSFELETGTLIDESVPEHDASFGSDYGYNGSVVFATVDDQVLLFHAYETDGDLRVRAFNADDGSHVHTADQESPFSDESPIQDAEIVDINGEHVLVTADGGRWSGDASYLFDAATGELLWSKDQFRAVAVQDGAVSGVAYPDEYRSADEVEFQVLSIEDDSTIWNQTFDNDPETSNLGDGIVLIYEPFVVSFGGSDNSNRDAVVLNTADATVLAATVGDGDPACGYDHVAVVACVDLGEQPLTAYSAEDGTVLWTADDRPAEQILPDKFLAEYEGVLYMGNKSGDRPPVALDAATGEQIADNLPAGLVVVGPGFCVALTDDRMVNVHTEA